MSRESRRHGTVALNTQTRSSLSDSYFMAQASLWPIFSPPHCTTLGYYIRSLLLKQNQCHKDAKFKSDVVVSFKYLSTLDYCSRPADLGGYSVNISHADILSKL